MKLQILLLFCIFSFCSCQISQKAQKDQPPAEPEASRSNESVLPTQSPKPVDESRFESVEIKRTDHKARFSLNIDIEYPQLKKPKTSQEIKFNQYVKKQVDGQLLDFTNFLIDKEKNVKDRTKYEYEINLDYKVDYYSDNFTSILMDWNAFSGYLNYDYFPSTINYDLTKGKDLGFEDLFYPKSNYLDRLSNLSRKILKRTCLSCPCSGEIRAGDPLPDELIAEEANSSLSGNINASNAANPAYWLERGTEPKVENFANWSITAEGLKITFGEYQVGPGCIGIIDVVIPFADLEPILRKDEFVKQT